MRTVEPIRDSEKIEEIKRVLRRDGYRNWFLFVLGINTGMRISDLLKLQVKHVRGKTHIKMIEQKTGKAKVFKINASLRMDIDEYIFDMEPEAFLFPSRLTDLPIKRVQAYKILNRAANKVGLDGIGTHTLRKTFGYHFYKRNKDVAMLQNIFNHSSPSVTLRYIGIAQEQIDEVIDDFYL
ncbi:site-specific integrase (plasmid) [Pseudalkalibacillus hwajinpoensis]|uniref:site-specific integrase n=1 Tax=Guptibacillus hwajinpoensis TaxID=208199 RepID=UPI00325B0D31